MEKYDIHDSISVSVVPALLNFTTDKSSNLTDVNNKNILFRDIVLNFENRLPFFECKKKKKKHNKNKKHNIEGESQSTEIKNNIDIVTNNIEEESQSTETENNIDIEIINNIVENDLNAFKNDKKNESQLDIVSTEIMESTKSTKAINTIDTIETINTINTPDIIVQIVSPDVIEQKNNTSISTDPASMENNLTLAENNLSLMENNLTLAENNLSLAESVLDWPKLSLDDINISLKVVSDLPKSTKLRVKNNCHLAAEESYFPSLARYTDSQKRDKIISYIYHMCTETERQMNEIILNIRINQNREININNLKQLMYNLSTFLHRYDNMRSVYNSDSTSYTSLGNIRDKFNNIISALYQKIFS